MELKYDHSRPFVPNRDRVNRGGLFVDDHGKDMKEGGLAWRI